MRHFRKKGSKGFISLTVTSDYPGHLWEVSNCERVKGKDQFDLTKGLVTECF